MLNKIVNINPIITKFATTGPYICMILYDYVQKICQETDHIYRSYI